MEKGYKAGEVHPVKYFFSWMLGGTKPGQDAGITWAGIGLPKRLRKMSDLLKKRVIELAILDVKKSSDVFRVIRDSPLKEHEWVRLTNAYTLAKDAKFEGNKKNKRKVDESDFDMPNVALYIVMFLFAIASSVGAFKVLNLQVNGDFFKSDP